MSKPKITEKLPLETPIALIHRIDVNTSKLAKKVKSLRQELEKEHVKNVTD